MAKKILKLNLGDIIKTTGNKKLKKLSVLLNLIAPHIDITDDILNAYDEEGLATSYDILVDGVVKATIMRLARPTISLEETYINGAAIENAKSYKLLKVADDQYTDIGEQVIGKQNEGFTKGYVNSTGAFVSDETIGWRYTDFIHINQLADINGACVMVTPDTDNSINYCVANFYTDNDVNSFVGGLTYNDMNSSGFAAEDVVYYAQSKNAKYVVFSSRWQSAESLWVNLTDSIFFNLDEYADVLTAGENHTLVVKACGDGTNYIDSNYSNEIEYVVEEPVVEDELQGTWVWNDSLNIGDYDYGAYDLIFLSNGIEYTSLIIESWDNDGQDALNYYAENEYANAYRDGVWLNNAYKTINITSKLSEVENGEALLTWLKANATKQSATTPTLITFTIGSTTYQAEEGMTWGEWVESEYNTGGYKLNVSVVTTSDGRSVLSNGSAVYTTDTLNAGEAYTTGLHSGGAGTN